MPRTAQVCIAIDGSLNVLGQRCRSGIRALGQLDVRRHAVEQHHEVIIVIIDDDVAGSERRHLPARERAYSGELGNGNIIGAGLRAG